MIAWYEPDEDTYTLIDVLEKEDLRDKMVVDLGTSTGIITSKLRSKNTVISIDLNIRALDNHSGGNLVRGDLMFCIEQKAVDVVIFNPPYVPDTDDPIIGGGPFGRMIIDRFVNTVTTKALYLLVIEANKPKEVVELLGERGYRTEILRKRTILGETIYIIKGQRTH